MILINTDEKIYYNHFYIMKNQERRKRLESVDLTKQYQCFVCLERLIDPRKCQQCRKILCGAHIPNLKDRCPNCRTTPFKFVIDDTLNIVLQCIKRQEWQSLKKSTLYNCKIQSCKFVGKYVDMIKHRKKGHFEKSIEQVMLGNDAEKNKKELAKILKKLKAYRITIQTLSAVQNMLQPENPEQKKKHPTHIFAREMAMHINECASNDCKKMWNVKWGSYIGNQGEDVQEYFYLSQCPIGKQINIRLGWDYSNPKH